MIILAFIAGLAFALGHHAFYSSLDGQTVDDHLFNQQINLAVGQAFAFLVRASLVISIGASYWQVFWGTVLHRTLAVSQADVLAGMLGSVLDLLDLKASRTRPLLVVLALLSWMVPLASILPPATLSVHSTTTPEYEQGSVPIPRFDGTDMAILPVDVDNDTSKEHLTYVTLYQRPTRQLLRLATATAYQGAVPDLRTAYYNSTYMVHFPGPAMRCQVVPEDLLHDFNEPMGCNFMPNELNNGMKADCQYVFTYLSWVPSQKRLIPYEPYSMANGTMPRMTDPFSLEHNKHYIGRSINAPASVYLATRSRRLPYNLDNWDILNCSIYNASYSVNVTSDSNGRGVVSMLESRALNSVPFGISGPPHRANDSPFSAKDSETFGYLALMECLTRLVVGTMFGNEYAKTKIPGYYSAEWLVVQNQGFQQTLLPFTAELLLFKAYEHIDEKDYPNFRQWEAVDTLEWVQDGKEVVSTVSYPQEAFLSPAFNRSLASVVEELFQNMTLSLMSTQGFQRDAKDINMTFYRTQNTYAYDSRNLLISYGLAVSFALLAGVAGCISIYYTGASYSNKFSTVLRTTRGQELEELVVQNDRTGVDPLPKRLAKTRIDLRRGQLESGRDADNWRPETVSEQRLL